MIEPIDYSKYRRFFTFGCSFTRYSWATWADILAQEMPQAEFYNFGRGGGGNLFISSRIAEANVRYKFCETDLVAVMFTTFTREDRWVNGSWLTLGNIYNQDSYPKAWVEKFADEIGYLIRDLSLIELSSQYLLGLPCRSICMAARPFSEAFEGPDREHLNTQMIIDRYHHLQQRVITLYDIEQDIIDGKTGHSFYHDGQWRVDGHPRPLQYLRYLEKAGINLTHRGRDYATERERLLLDAQDYTEIYKNVPNTMSTLPEHQLF